MDFACTGEGVRESYFCMSEAVKSFRLKGVVEDSWNREEKTIN